MRQIKFRGKASDKEWVYGYLIVMPDNSCGIFQLKNYEEGAVDVQPKTIGQFTGLRDKTGKDIYEGDILKKETKHCELGVFVVEFINGLNWNYNGFGLRSVKDGKIGNFNPESIYFPADEPGNWDTIIGNIHDNPELINEI